MFKSLMIIQFFGLQDVASQILQLRHFPSRSRPPKSTLIPHRRQVQVVSREPLLRTGQ